MFNYKRMSIITIMILSLLTGCSGSEEPKVDYRVANNFLRMQINVLKIQKWANSPQSYNEAQILEILADLKSYLILLSAKELEDFTPELKKEYMRVLNDADVAAKKLGKENADSLIDAYIPSSIFKTK
ncbi:MAG: hypothetical protein J0L60_14795 [Ignavibacteria bacterium]|nr:hypothetical protein [Ignavibacteria bacterium]